MPWRFLNYLCNRNRQKQQICSSLQIAWVLQTMQMAMGSIKSTDHRPTDHRPTKHRPLTNRRPAHRPTDPAIIFESLSNRKIFILQNTHTTEKIISVYHLFDERLQKKTWLPIKHNTYFLTMDISIRPDVFFTS